MKKHKDCAFLHDNKDGTYICCDSRSKNKCKVLTNIDIEEVSCEYFHPKEHDVIIHTS